MITVKNGYPLPRDEMLAAWTGWREVGSSRCLPPGTYVSGEEISGRRDFGRGADILDVW